VSPAATVSDRRDRGLRTLEPPWLSRAAPR
jgi:hypothetical protein